MATTNLLRGYQLILELTEVQVNIETNASLVHRKLYLYDSTGYGAWNSNPSSWTFTSASGQTTYDFRFTTVKVLFEDDAWIAHAADGSGSYSASGSFSDNGGLVGSGSVSQEIVLSTIPRASQPTLSKTTFDAGETITINTNRASGTFTHKIRFGFGNTWITVATGVTDSVAFTPPLSLLSEIPNDVSGTGQVTCETFSGGSSVGTKNVLFTMKVPATIVPTIASVAYKDTQSWVQAIIGNNQILVQNKSLLEVTGTTIASNNSATLKTLTVSIGGNEYSAALTGTSVASKVIAVGALDLNSNATATLTVTDSRGRTAAKTFTVQIKPYDVPLYLQATADRTNSYEPSSRLNLKIRVRKVNVTADKNVATSLQYRMKLQGSSTWAPDWTTITLPTPTTEGDYWIYTVSFYLGDFANSNAYSLEVRLLDTLSNGTYTSTTVTLRQGIALLKFEKDKITAGVQMYQMGVMVANGFLGHLPNGDFYNSAYQQSLKQGFYWRGSGSTVSNSPSRYGFVEVSKDSGTSFSLTFHNVDTNVTSGLFRVYKMSGNASSYLPWYAQLDSSFVKDYIVDQGIITYNGIQYEYTKMNSGRMELDFVIASNGVALSAWGNIFISSILSTPSHPSALQFVEKRMTFSCFVDCAAPVWLVGRDELAGNDVMRTRVLKQSVASADAKTVDIRRHFIIKGWWK